MSENKFESEEEQRESEQADEMTKLHKQRDNFQNIIVALCDRDSRCTVCYRYMSDTNSENCSNCNEYYCECNCTPLTPDEIVNGEVP